MKTSKYIDQIATAREAVGALFTIPGNLLLVERLPVEEIKSKGGIIIADNSKKQMNTLYGDLPLEVIVVAIGAGYDNDGEDVPLDTLPGDLLIVGDNAVKWLGSFPIDGYEANTLGICAEENTQIRFRGSDAYARFKAATTKP